MNNNCLVTKLKGSVSGADLPIFKSVRIDLLESASRSGDLTNILVGAGSNPVTVDSQVSFHVSELSNPAVTQVTVPANTMYTLSFKKEEMPVGGVTNAIILSGGIYSMTALSVYPNATWFKVKQPDHGSVLYSDDLVSDVCMPDDTIKSGVKVLTINDTIYNRDNYNALFENSNDVAYLYGNNINSIAVVVGIEDLSKCVNLKYLYCRPKGSIINLPLNIMVLGFQSSLLTGSLESFVADRRSRGVTSGTLRIESPTSVWNITYNNTPIKELSAAIMPVANHTTYFTWDASNMGFSDQAPAGFTDYSSVYFATEAVLNGNL